MSNKELIHRFYTAFSEGNSKEMVACYHDDITFQDPVFGQLQGQRAKAMWLMLLSKKNSKSTITFDGVEVDDTRGKATWVAEYYYGDKKRKVVNRVSASFKFQDGKIIEHTDIFDLWLWTKQAMGFVGYLIGWSSLLKNKIQKTTNSNLYQFMNNTSL